MISRHDECRDRQAHAMHEHMRRLKFAMPRSLAQISRDHQRRWGEGRQELLECFYLFEVGVPAKVQIGEMNDGDY
jgi:hypothetical protein